MAKSGTCPKCKKRTYSVKFNQCTNAACSLQPQVIERMSLDEMEARRSMLDKGPGYEPERGETFTVTQEGQWQGTRHTLVPGEPCPACGKPVGKSQKVLQKEYRERKKRELGD